MSDVYADEAVKTVLECADKIERQGQGLMIIRDVRANEVGTWMKDIAAEMKAACQSPGSDGTPFDEGPSAQRKSYEQGGD